MITCTLSTYIAWIIYRICIPSSQLEKAGLEGSPVQHSSTSLDTSEDSEGETIDIRIYRGLVCKVSEETNLLFGRKSMIIPADLQIGCEGLLEEDVHFQRQSI